MNSHKAIHFHFHLSCLKSKTWCWATLIDHFLSIKHPIVKNIVCFILVPPSLFKKRLVLCSSTFNSVELHKTKTRLKYSLSKQWQKAIQSAFNLIVWLIVPITFEPVRPCELLFGQFILSGESWMGHFCSCGHYMTSFPWHALLRGNFIFLRQMEADRGGGK